MSTFGLICTLVSIAIFAVWLTICIKKFGLAPSYSAYNPMWDKAVPIDNMHLWSIITFVIAATFISAPLGEPNATTQSTIPSESPSGSSCSLVQPPERSTALRRINM